MDQLHRAQTSVPDWIMEYCHQLADVYYRRKLESMYVEMLEEFLALKPYRSKADPVPWYAAKVHAYKAGATQRESADLGWVPMNMRIPNDLVERIKREIEIVNANALGNEKKLSMRSFIYTAVVWWCSKRYPYKGIGLLYKD